MVTTHYKSLISIIALVLTSRCSAQRTSAPALQTISIGTGEFVIDPNNVILDGTTVSAGGPAITINNEPVLMDVADDLFVGDKEVLTGRATKINITGSVSSQNAATSSVRAGNSSSSMRIEYSSSTTPQPEADLNIAALQAFVEYLQTRSGASGFSQTISLLNSTVQSATGVSSITSPSKAQGNFQASSLLSSTAQLTPWSSSIASSSTLGVHGNVVISISSSGNSPSASTFSGFESALQPQNNTSSSASSKVGIGGLGGQNASTKSWTASSILGSPSLAISSLSSLVVNPKSAITTFAPATGFIATASSQPNITVASSSVLILVGALLSLSAQGKSISDEISLPPTKTSFIKSIETIESQVIKLKGLLGGLGGNTVAPPSCHASKSKARFKKRDLLGDLDKILSDVECAAQDLSSLTIKLQAEHPTPDDISPALDDLGDTASDMEKSDDDDDDDDTSTESPSQAGSSKESPSQTRTSTRSQTMTTFGSTVPNSISSSSVISSQTTIEYPCYSGSLYMDPFSISDDADEVSAFNALLPSLLSSEFGADLSGFVTIAASANSSANATSAVSTTSTAAGGKGISVPSTTQTIATPNSSEQSWLSSRLAPATSPPTPQITVTSKPSLQPSLSSRQTAAELTSSGQTPTSSPTANAAANIVEILANLPSHPACSMVLANTGDGCAGVDYCDCSATYVPPLTSTVNGSVTSGCSYATQPPANDCPINSIALEVASAIINLRLTSSASDDVPTSIPSTGSAPSRHHRPAPGSETPAYSGLDTPTSFTPPEPTTSPSTPFPSIVSHNNKGSTLCSSLNNGGQSCKAAYSYYNPEYLYLDYTAYVQTDDTLASGFLAVVSPTADRGCTAMLKCAPGAVGLYGKQIIAAFDALYSYADVQICGSIYLANGCWMTTDFCSKCEASVPCAALPVEVQPEQGGSWPCYFPNGTVWHG